MSPLLICGDDPGSCSVSSTMIVLCVAVAVVFAVALWKLSGRWFR